MNIKMNMMNIKMNILKTDKVRLCSKGLLLVTCMTIGIASAQAQESSRQMYQQECSDCHVAYPPALLPKSSWQLIMSQLDDHYGDNAEVDQQTQLSITEYLVEQSSKRTRSRLRKMLRGSQGTTPLRITELPYFIDEHDDVPQRLVQGNPQVGSFSQCDSCHKDAAKGEFDEDTVSIPGYGAWDD